MRQPGEDPDKERNFSPSEKWSSCFHGSSRRSWIGVTFSRTTVTFHRLGIWERSTHQNPSQNLPLDTRRPRGRWTRVKTSCPILKSFHTSLTVLTGSGFQPIRLRSTFWNNIKTRSITFLCLETQPSFTRNIRCLLSSSESSSRPCSTRTGSKEWADPNGWSACKNVCCMPPSYPSDLVQTPKKIRPTKKCPRVPL